jgi:hypothetical protein
MATTFVSEMPSGALPSSSLNRSANAGGELTFTRTVPPGEIITGVGLMILNASR